jgi:hypothetical protein
MLLYKYHSKQEIINFILWSIKPINFFVVFQFYLKKIVEKYLKRSKNSFLEENTTLFKDTILEIKNYNFDKDIIVDNSINIIPSRVKVISTYIKIDKSPKWKHNFEDEEYFFSLHRWNWLLISISENKPVPTFEWGITVIRSWIDEMGVIPNTKASESYSVGERIVNLLLFSRITRNKWDDLPTDINKFILENINYLMNNLEFYGKNLTGNHLFNNARALYITSKVYGLKYLEKFSKKIIKERLNTLITDDGFLREGSSHYHFLFTRWVFELYLISYEFGDKKFNAFLENELESLISKCNFFIVESNNEIQMPLFGDVSPDFDPEWLIDIPILWRGLKNKNLNIYKLKGWSNLIKNAFEIKPTNKHKNSKKKFFNNFEESGWHKLDWKKWNIIWHTKTKNCKSRATHSHQDFGSFVVFYDGKELIKDIGRPNYNLESKLGISSTLANFHNSILVDKMPISLFPYDNIFPDKYTSVNYKFDLHQTKDSLKIIFSHDGYSRLVNKNLKHTRIFHMTEKNLNIIDDFRGGDTFEIELNLYLNNLTEHEIHIIEHINSENTTSEINKKRLDYWSFPRYGFKEVSPRINTKLRITGPSNIAHQIKIKN